MRECFSCAGRNTDGTEFPGVRKPRCRIDLCNACLKGEAKDVANWATLTASLRRKPQTRAKFRAAIRLRAASQQMDMIDPITPAV